MSNYPDQYLNLFTPPPVAITYWNGDLFYLENEIKKYADKLKWNISKYKIINEKNENSTAPIAAKLASEDKVKIIVKGHIHTDVLMKAVLKRDLNLIGKKSYLHFSQ